MQRFSAVAVLACGLLMFDDPTIAQSSSTFERARVSFTSVHQYVAAEAIPRQLALPPNLVVSPVFRPLVESMLRDSPTFRRQCVRIGGEPSLTVRLDIVPTPQLSSVRAMTRLTRNDRGHLAASVGIGSSREIEELIAHEFEHIIEQLDGVNLAAHAALPHTGVTNMGHANDVFETTRAKRMGLKVVSELGR